MALLAIASGLYHLLARRMHGYGDAQERHLFRDLIDMPADVVSDEAAAKFVEFLHELTATMERHYCGQLLRYYHRDDIAQCDLVPAPPPTDPPF